MNEAIFCFYGYFLKGTGSAIYARELCRSLNSKGENIILFSQEDEPEAFDFIASAFDVFKGKLRLRFEKETEYAGKTIHIKPDTRGFLPVYVYDSYPGYKVVKTFSQIEEAELFRYLSYIKEAYETFKKAFNISCKGVIVHHLVPIPYLLSDIHCTGGRLAVFHGSDLNFAIRKSELMAKIFKESLTNLDSIIALTDAGADDLLSFLPEAEEKIKIVHPGIDTSIFYPRKSRELALDEFRTLFFELSKNNLEQQERKSYIEAIKSTEHYESLKLLSNEIEKLEARKMPEPDLYEFLERNKENKIILFAGKYLWTKGPAALIIAMPFIWKEFPETALLLIGFGASRGFLEKLIAELAAKNVDAAVELILSHKLLDPGSKEDVLMDAPSDFAQKLKNSDFARYYLNLCNFRNFEEKVKLAGYLDHKRLAPVLSMADIFVAPSLFRESFGMVLLEAASSGTLPVSSCHSGFSDISKKIASILNVPEELLCVKLSENFIEDLSASILKGLSIVEANPELSGTLYEFVKTEFSWDASSKKIIELLKG